MATIIVGILFVAIIAYALRKTIKGAKQGGCAGCSGSCKHTKDCDHHK